MNPLFVKNGKLSKKFEHSSKEFEIWHVEIPCEEIGEEHCVAVFHKGRQVSPIYSICRTPGDNLQNETIENFINWLGEIAQEEIKEGKYVPNDTDGENLPKIYARIDQLYQHRSPRHS